MNLPDYAQNDVTAKYIPSPEDILKATIEIQKSWSASEERKRRGGLDLPYEFIQVKPPKYGRGPVRDT